MNTTNLPTPPPDPNAFSGASVVPVAAVTMAMSSLFVGLRFWSRGILLRVVGLEDWFILIALIFALGTSISMIIQLNYGLGRPFLSLSPEDVVSYFKVRSPEFSAGILTSIIYAAGLTFVKLSILFLYIRVLTYDYVRFAAKLLLVVVIITHLWIILSLFTACVPLDAFWDFAKRPTAYCHPLVIFWSHAGLNIATDFLIFLLPLTVMGKLRAPGRQKAALYAVFTVAFIVCIISILRSVQLANDGNSPNPDLTWDATRTANWTMLEVNVAVITACLPTIKPAVSRLFPRLLASTPSTEAERADNVIETVGRAPRRLELDPLHSTFTTSTAKESEDPGAKTEDIAMKDLEAQKGEGAGLEFLSEPEGLRAPERARVRTEPSCGSLGGPAVMGHSAV